MIRSMNSVTPSVTYAGSRETSRDVERLFCAAVVNKAFCARLLKDPAGTAAEGYQGERFDLPAAELRRMQSIRATSLKEFAAQYLRADEMARVPCAVAAGD